MSLVPAVKASRRAHVLQMSAVEWNVCVPLLVTGQSSPSLPGQEEETSKMPLVSILRVLQVGKLLLLKGEVKDPVC